MVRTSIIVTLVLVSLFTIGTLIFMIIAIVSKSNCENSESPGCATFSCPDYTGGSVSGGQGKPATRPG